MFQMDKFIELFFNKDHSLNHKITGLAVILIFSLIIDNITGFSFFQFNGNKIEQLENLTKLSNNYSMRFDTEFQGNISEIKSEILSRETLFNQHSRCTFFNFISSSLILIVLLIRIWFCNKPPIEIVLQSTIIIIGIMILFHYLTSLIPVIWNPWINYLLNIVITTIVIIRIDTFLTVTSKHNELKEKN